MAEASQKPAKGNTAVPTHGDHDRVAMLSLKADGTPDQHEPEMIADPEGTLAATRRQYVEQAVSAADVQLRRTEPGAANVTIIGKAGDEPDEVVPATTDAAGEDPTVAATRQAHEAAAKAAGSAAEATLRALHPER